MSTLVRWTVAALAALLAVGMLVWARGEDHHRGDDVGSLGTAHTPVAGP